MAGSGSTGDVARATIGEREMAKAESKADSKIDTKSPNGDGKKEALRLPAEVQFRHELEALAKEDKHPRPEGWNLSPRAVETYLLGGKAGGVEITPKYLGSQRLVQIAITSLATDRALLLVGEPGTAKSWLSEHITAAICGDSLMLVQGTAGTTEEQIRYSWNYALLLAEGPSPKALVPSPVFHAMEQGKIVRFEEITRCPAEVQDALITVLSEKLLTVPELGVHVHAKRGFSLIATANTRDRGVNDMSAALKRRFNIVVLPVPDDMETEIRIVMKRVAEIGSQLKLPAPPPTELAVAKIVQVFQELRKGQTIDGKQKLKSPSSLLSTAECISLIGGGMALAGHFGNGRVDDRDLAAGLHAAVLKEDTKDAAAWNEYLENIVKKRGSEWDPLYKACRELLGPLAIAQKTK
jgi:MoxR-like ATPase